MTKKEANEKFAMFIQLVVALITGSVGFVLYGSTIEGFVGSIIIGTAFYVFGYTVITALLGIIMIELVTLIKFITSH